MTKLTDRGHWLLLLVALPLLWYPNPLRSLTLLIIPGIALAAWLARLMIEPRRLWKRHPIGNPLFIYRVLKERFPSPRFITRHFLTKTKILSRIGEFIEYFSEFFKKYLRHSLIGVIRTRSYFAIKSVR